MTPNGGRESQMLIPSGDGHIAGMLHSPEETVSSSAVLFCAPFGDERKSAWRVLTQMSRAVAAAGWPVLRFDYRGCGESPGEFVDATLDTRLADIASAASHLRETLGVEKICLLGLRFGATLAVRAAKDLEGAESAILLEPVLDGQQYFARMEQRKKLRQMMTQGRAEGQGSPRDILDLDGYAVRRETLSDLEGVRIETAGATTLRRSLLVQMSFNEKLRPETERCREVLADGGGEVQLEKLVMPPFWSRVDIVDTQRLDLLVTRWLQEKRV